VGILSIVIAGSAQGTAISSIAINSIAWACALQLGYLGGLFARFVMVAARTMTGANSLARAQR
jgi:hypothetical protein